MRKLIFTRVALRTEDNENESDEIRKLKGEGENEPDIWGKGTFLIDEIAGVVEHYPSVEEGPDPEQCNVTFKNGRTWGVQTPYEDVKQLLREFHGETEETGNKKIDLGRAIAVLTDALDNDEDLYRAYKDNIAMAFKDEYGRRAGAAVMRMTNDLLHEVANTAADNFLKLLIKSTQ